MKTDTHEKRSVQLHSVQSAAALLQCSEAAIRAWLTQGKLARVKVGRLTRIHEHEILALIVPQENGGARG